ncbi:SDR family oxidoreductase [Streptomyces avicenniae]|uniref:SDR family oxidoreductase n=1 Tax=Streptomyces avicenniae TaxID=500153 RepID=UPI00069A3E61|nr:SDR family oxidoreductase [Streptomyces avicenniae]
MTSPILVTGGTGTLGRHVVPRLRAAGFEVRVLTRNGRAPEDGVTYVTGDLEKDTGVAAALDGAGTILHLAGDDKNNETVTRHLVRAASDAGTPHLINISVTATDRLPIGYFRSKLAAENVLIEGGVPWTNLRAAQFHDFALNAVRVMGRLPVIPSPGGMRAQPVDARDVADRLVELAQGGPAGHVRDLVGPQVYTLGELARGYLAARGKRRPMLPVRVPGAIGRAYREGRNLVLDDVDEGTRTWEAFLAEQTW